MRTTLNTLFLTLVALTFLVGCGKVTSKDSKASVKCLMIFTFPMKISVELPDPETTEDITFRISHNGQAPTTYTWNSDTVSNFEDGFEFVLFGNALHLYPLNVPLGSYQIELVKSGSVIGSQTVERKKSTKPCGDDIIEVEF